MIVLTSSVLNSLFVLSVFSKNTEKHNNNLAILLALLSFVTYFLGTWVNFIAVLLFIVTISIMNEVKFLYSALPFAILGIIAIATYNYILFNFLIQIFFILTIELFDTTTKKVLTLIALVISLYFIKEVIGNEKINAKYITSFDTVFVDKPSVNVGHKQTVQKPY